MNVKKFTAGTSREALRLVRNALGLDALIISNREVDGQVEIVALASGEVGGPAAAPLPAAPPARASSAAESAPIAPPSVTAESAPVKPIVAADRPPLPAPAAAGAHGDLRAVMGEIRAMRSMLENRLHDLPGGRLHDGGPQPSPLECELLAAGFSPQLTRHLAARPDCAKGGLAKAKSMLARNLLIREGRTKFLDKGGVYALVGPTGVGKTTTTAKLAARCVMRHGSGKLALITTDSYRIGAYEQLRIYGKILGVMVHSVKDEPDLRLALAELRNRHTILIDTVGMSQRDRMVAEQVALLSGAGTEVKRLLCLNATSAPQTLEEVVHAYRGADLAGCIITKIDEAASIGGVLDVIIRHQLTLYCVADGQRVPEDLRPADPLALVRQAFQQRREAAAFAPPHQELALLAARAPRYASAECTRETRLD